MASQSVQADEQIMLLNDPMEIRFLQAYRSSDDAGKRDIAKLLHAGVSGLLPSAGTIEAMTAPERRAYIDSLPEVPETEQ